MPVQKQAGSGFESFTFYLSLLLLAAAIGSFFYFQYQAGQKNAELATLSAEAAKSKTAEQKNLENRILTVRQQLRDFATAINERQLGTAFFAKFETLVFPEVYFTKCAVNMPDFKANLSGHAPDFETLSRQMTELQSAADMFDSVVLGKTGISEKGGIDFDIQLIIKEDALLSK